MRHDKATGELHANSIALPTFAHREIGCSEVLSWRCWQDYDLIFPSLMGTPQNRSNIQVDFQWIQEIAGLPKFRFHDLCHMAASILPNNGVPVVEERAKNEQNGERMLREYLLHQTN